MDIRRCQFCGLEDPSLIVGSCLGCISEKKGYERCRADVVAWLMERDRQFLQEAKAPGSPCYMANQIGSGASDGFAKEGT